MVNRSSIVVCNVWTWSKFCNLSFTVVGHTVANTEQWGVWTTLDSRKRTLARASSGWSVIRDEPGRAAILLDSRRRLLWETDEKDDPEKLYFSHAALIADRRTNTVYMLQVFRRVRIGTCVHIYSLIFARVNACQDLSLDMASCPALSVTGVLRKLQISILVSLKDVPITMKYSYAILTVLRKIKIVCKWQLWLQLLLGIFIIAVPLCAMVCGQMKQRTSKVFVCQ